MTIEQVIKQCNKFKFHRIYSGICSNQQCKKIFFNCLVRVKYCYPGCTDHSILKKQVCEFCTYCKKIFYRSFKRMTRSKKPFCSRKCFYTYAIGGNHPAYKNTNLIDNHGYRVITFNSRRIKEHRHIMEQHIGRRLNSSEHVHHINNIKTDNRIENLQLMTSSQHQILHWATNRRKEKSL